ncbi:MAG: type I restriction enzyme HsdR N-terminal domain-containing protein [Sulfuricellaceae bacterium]|nr:type I restriction enzyme HsdR N-terminal domain-containing protein [Sulfuricellaceae bacterium]
MSALTELLKDSAYKLSQFNAAKIAALEAGITVKDAGKKPAPYFTCLVRGKPIKLTPEEAVRQLYVMVLRDDLGYPVNRMALEYEVTFGREKKRADICVFDKDKTTTPLILVELKKPKLKDGKDQLKSYCHATGAPMGVWTNGEQISYYHRKDPNYFEDIPAIPSAHEKLSDILSERWTIDDLVKLDKLVNEKKSLKDLILEMEDEVLANAGVDVFEELFKLIFTKLFDEMESGRDKKRHLVFKNYGDTETELKAKIQNLFDKARDKWEGVFPDGAKIDLTPSHLAVCVSSLEKVKLFNSNLEDTTQCTPTFPEFLRASGEKIFKLADGSYRKVKVKNQNTVGRDVLFIERNLSFLKPGGRMAVVLPQGRFNNSSDKDIREYLADHCRILAVVGLHGNVFKPHTGTKTSVLFVQKWNDDPAAGALCPRVDDYPIFFATMKEPSKDNSGDKIYVKQGDLKQWDETAKPAAPLRASEPVDRYDVALQTLSDFVLDEHEHLIVKHDLFSHALKDGKRTPDGIAEAFIEFAKKEKLGFWLGKP